MVVNGSKNRLPSRESSLNFNEIIYSSNLSRFVENDTQKGKVRLNHIVDIEEKVKESLLYIINNYKKERKNNPDKFGYMHCIEAAAIMAEYGFCEIDEIAAALLHDVWEDIPNWEEYLKSTYDENIISLVKALTEGDKSGYSLKKNKETREKRKLEDIEKVSHFSPKELALKLADQISNIAETVDDLEKMTLKERKRYWKCFHAGYDKQIWKYKTLGNVIKDRIQVCENEGLFKNEIEKLNLTLLFEKYKKLVDMLDLLMTD